MLVLTRRTNERIRLEVPMPDGTSRFIWVTLVEMRSGYSGNQVKLGFTCDDDIIIAREEIIPEATR